jgi:hypothetical protein
MNLAALLEHGISDFLNVVRDASLTALPAPTGTWSTMEIIEHVVVFEERYLDWIRNGSDPPSPRDPDRELRLFSRIRSRLYRLDAPQIFQPCGRFANVAASLAAFQTTRERTILEVRQLGDRIYEIGVEHPYFGIINGGELVHLIDGHARRHSDQIRELSEAG